MLTLTDDAATAVKDIATKADLPESGGLRIARSPEDANGIVLSLSPEPVDGDQVVDSGPARVFVSPDTAPALDALTLDADLSAEAPSFSLHPTQA